MASKIFFVFIFLALQYEIVLSSPSLRMDSTDESKTAPISLSEFVFGMRSIPDNSVAQYLLMMMTASYAGRFYDLSANLSVECSKTIRASWLTVENLAVCQEANAVVQMETSAAAREVKNAKQLKEHPLELYCRRSEKTFAENPKLKVVFEKAKGEAAKFDFTARPPYSRMFLRDPQRLAEKLWELLTVSEFARVNVVGLFARQTDATVALAPCTHYFVKSCQAVAKSQLFADSIQSLYEKALNETMIQIFANDTVKLSAAHRGEVIYLPILVKKLYNSFASDANLKKEFENTVAVFGKDASKEDLDFSKCEPLPKKRS